MSNPLFNQRSRTRRTNAEVAAARDAVHAAQDELIAKYRKGATMKELAAASGVDRGWLRTCFEKWDEPIRGGGKP